MSLSSRAVNRLLDGSSIELALVGDGGTIDKVPVARRDWKVRGGTATVRVEFGPFKSAGSANAVVVLFDGEPDVRVAFGGIVQWVAGMTFPFEYSLVVVDG